MKDFHHYLHDTRHQFLGEPLNLDNSSNNPYDLFEKWFIEAVETGVLEPFAMSLATVSSENMPSVRIVYLRDIGDDGLVFFTNYQSRKGRDISVNPVGCANLYWPECHRQVRFSGELHKLDDDASNEYFASRPRESQIGAWASHQSHPLNSREELEERAAELVKEFEGIQIPRPGFWGGYRLAPMSIEFWQGRPNRLHDRILYQKAPHNSWEKKRLFP